MDHNIDLYALMEKTGFHKNKTLLELSQLTGKSCKECKSIVDDAYAELEKKSVSKNSASENVEAVDPSDLDTNTILISILEELRESNWRLSRIEDCLQSYEENSFHAIISGIYDKIDDISSELSDIKGNGLFNSLSDVCAKLDEIYKDMPIA